VNRNIGLNDVLEPDRRRETGTTADCRKELSELLSDHKPHPAEAITDELKAKGYSERTIQRAASGVKIKRAKTGFGEAGWAWKLP
jgi:hypothetical protein